MRITYDFGSGWAHIYLVDQINAGEAKSTLPVRDSPHGMINLDFDGEGRLLGIEVENAAHALRSEYFRPA
jgi:uncharacterized protein YuzE